MGTNSLVAASGMGVLDYLLFGAEPTPGGQFTFLDGTVDLPIGSTSCKLVNTGNVHVGQVMYFDDNRMVNGRDQTEAINKSEPAFTITAVNQSTRTVTFTPATSVLHYAPLSSSQPQSGSRVHTSWVATQGLGYESQSLESKVDFYGPKVADGSRSLKEMLPVHETVSGALVIPFGPGKGSDFMVGGWGYETETFQASGTPTVGGAPNSTINVGDISFQTTATFTANQILIFDATPNREIRRVLNVVAGTPNVVTVDKPFRFVHTTAAAITISNVALFQHTVKATDFLASYVLHKYISGKPNYNGATANLTSNTAFAYTYSVVDKIGLKIDTKGGPKATFDFMCQSENLVPALVPGVYPTASSFTSDQLFIQVNGVQDQTVEELEFMVDNGYKPGKFFDATRKLAVLDPTERKITGKTKYMYTVDESYTNFKAGVPAGFSFSLFQPKTQYSFGMNLTNIIYDSYKISDPMNDRVTVEAAFRSLYDVATGVEGTMTLVDGNYLNYGL